MSADAPPAASGLEEALRKVSGGPVTPADDALAVDGLTPRFIVAPAAPDQLAQALAFANEQGAAVVPWGGGRHMALGNMPERYDVALRTTKLDRVIEYEPADLTITVEAGITFDRLQSVLRERSQFLPIDAPGEATVGGALAVGVSGPSRHAYGLPRDWLIGCRVAHPDGSISKGGGRVVKNVAGYDLPKLAVGSLGTLGVIVEATFKVAPFPATQETLLAAHDALEDAARAVSDADERGLALRAAALLDREAAGALAPDGPHIAAYWLAGPRTAVERTRRELRALSSGEIRRLEADASDRWWAALSEQRGNVPSVPLRVTLLPSDVVPFIEKVRRDAAEAGQALTSVAYLTTGLVLARVSATDAESTVELIAHARRCAEEVNGYLVVEAAPVALKRRIDVWGNAGSALALMRRLKHQFDPLSTLNPGRYLGGI